MSTLGKIFLGFLAIIMILCVAAAASGVLVAGGVGYALTRTVKTDPIQVSRISSAITNYTVPTGFDEGFAARVFGFSMVGYTGIDQSSHIYLITVPAWLHIDPAKIADDFGSRSYGSRYTRRSAMTVVGSQSATIAGQNVTLAISEGTNHDNLPYRTLSGVFQVNGKPTFVSVSGLVNNWNQATVDQFLASIH